MNRELALFTELWPMFQQKERASAPTETHVIPANSLPQIDVIEHERDENQIVLEI
jgi:hypothetical protein